MADAIRTTAVIILLSVNIIFCDETSHPRRRPTLDNQMKFHPSEQITSSSDNIHSPPLRWLPMSSAPQVMSTAHASYNPLDYSTTPKANIVVNYFNSQPQQQGSSSHNQNDAFGTLADAPNAEEYVKTALKMRNHNVKHFPATSENNIHTATFTASNTPVKSYVKPKKYNGADYQHSTQDTLQGNLYVQQSLDNFHKQMEDWKHAQSNLKTVTSDNWHVAQQNHYVPEEEKHYQHATNINLRPHQSFDNVMHLNHKENTKIFDQHLRQLENLGTNHKTNWNSNQESHLHHKEPLVWHADTKPNYESKHHNRNTQIQSYSLPSKQHDIPLSATHHTQNLLNPQQIVSHNNLPIAQALVGEVPGYRSLEFAPQRESTSSLHHEQSQNQNNPAVTYHSLPMKDNFANVGASISVGQQLMKSEGPHGPITMINGLPIVNPYKIDLQTLRSMIGNTNEEKDSNPLQNIQDFQRENNYQVHEPKTENIPVQINHNNDNSGQYNVGNVGNDHQGSQGQYSHRFSSNLPFTPMKFNWNEGNNHKVYKSDLQGSYSMNSNRVASSGASKNVPKKKQRVTVGKNDSTRNLPNLHTELRPPPLNI